MCKAGDAPADSSTAFLLVTHGGLVVSIVDNEDFPLRHDLVEQKITSMIMDP